MELLSSSPALLGATLDGSHAQDQHDAFSDIDLTCSLSDETPGVREALIEQLAQLAPLFCRLWVYGRYALFLYENGVRLDVDFVDRDTFVAHVQQGRSRLIHDATGEFGDNANSGDRSDVVAAHPPHFSPGDPTYIDWYLWMFRQAICWCRRAAQGGEPSYEKLAGAIDSLAQVRASLVAMRIWVHGKKDYLSNIDPSLATKLLATHPKPDPADVLRNAFELFGLYESIAAMYCDRAGIAYPAEKIKRCRIVLADLAE